MSAYKILIADKMDKQAEEIFNRNNLQADVKPGLSEAELISIIDQYDGVAARSSAKITAPIIAAAKKLKVIGRAGIGVDTIDVKAATAAGIVVMNTPFGNSITTAEHTIAMMMALARQIPEANASTHSGKWEKSKFMGVELYGKVLGIIGCGNIGAIVASRALGLQMRVLAFDPYLTEDRARELGVSKVELDELYERSDFITIHTPKTDQTSGMINKLAFSKMKKGVRLINCARGGLIVEADLKDALTSGHVAGAALDVFEVEPAQTNILFGIANVVCTPHLGASTTEAQVNVAIQIAEQMSDFLLHGAVSNAVNMPSITAEEAPRLKPFMNLATQMGALAGQILEGAILEAQIEYIGRTTKLNTRALNISLMATLLQGISDQINMVNAMDIAKSKGIIFSETKTENNENLPSGIKLSVKTEAGQHSVLGTLFAGRDPRIVEIDGVPIEAALTPNMLYIRNNDQPGLIGAVGTILGKAQQNIADFRLGRVKVGGEAVALLSLDTALPDPMLTQIQSLPQVRSVKRLRFY